MATQKQISLFDPSILRPAIVDSFKKLHPRLLAKNPVMFVVGVGSLLTTALLVRDIAHHAVEHAPIWFSATVTVWLWFTVLFANFAEAVAEGRGKAQAASLRKMRQESTARRLVDGPNGKVEEPVPASQLRKGDRVVVEAGQLIPGDGEIIEGIASVDESAITGESAPVIRESGGDRSSVTGGTKVLSDRIVVRVTADPGESFLDRMIALVEGAARQKTPNEIALHILLVGLTIVFLFACVTLVPLALYSEIRLSATTIVALLVCLIPTTIGGLLSAIGIAGMDRLLRKNVIAMSGRAVEAAGDVDVLLLDKTGTITLGNRMATALIPAEGVRLEELADAAQLASLADETPEGRSVVVLVKEKHGLRGRNIHELGAHFIPFSATTRMSGCDLPNGGDHPRQIRKGAVERVIAYVESMRGHASDRVQQEAHRIADAGGTPLAVSDGNRVLGLIELKDVVKAGIQERFARFRAMGIRTVMITGDNPRTAGAIAKEAGVDDFLAEATPETKMRLIKDEQQKGKLVAMTGDGTNDAPALAQADVGVAMNTGTQAAKEAGNMVDLDSNPTKLLEVVEVGKQLLMTRGSLTTFSIANDVAKYFAILPAMFMGVFPQIAPLNVMHLASPYSAIVSAVIFNALIIILLIPLALRGVKYRPLGAAALLRRSLLLYGVGGVIAPFVGIKLIDVVLELDRSGVTMKPIVLLVALRFTLVTLFITGIAYPLGTTALAQLLFPSRANGSVVRDDRGQAVGSEPIGQSFGKPSYFWSRPSAAGDKGYDATASTGSNFGVTSKKLHERIAGDVERLRKANPDAPGEVPDDLVTASASGLDPHISVAAARWQTPRVAKARGVSVARVQGLVESSIEGRDLGFLGEPRVNVLLLNLALDRQFGASPR